MAAVHGQVEEMVSGLGLVRTRSRSSNNNANTSKVSTPATYNDRNSMETYLLAHGYTQAQLNSMNINDLVYATKLSQDPGII
jgi:hypothetical protein